VKEQLPGMRIPGCSCETTTEKVFRVLNQIEPHLCELHDADAIVKRERAKQLAAFDHDTEVIAGAVAQLDARDRATARGAAAVRRASELDELAGTDPFLAHIVKVSGAPVPAATGTGPASQVSPGMPTHVAARLAGFADAATFDPRTPIDYPDAA
jgi:hypothetical protein